MTQAVCYRPTAIRSGKIYEWCAYFALFGNILIFIGNPYKFDGLVSIGTKFLMIPNTLCGVIYLAIRIQQRHLFNETLWAMLIVVTSLLAFLASEIYSLYGSIESLMKYWAVPFYLLFYRDTENREKVRRNIYRCYILISLIYIYLSTTSLSHIGYNEVGSFQTDLSLGYNNTNETGMYLLVCFTVLLSASFYYKRKLLRISLWIDAVYLFYMIFETNARTCFLVAVFIAAMTIFNLTIKLKNKHILMIMLVPFVMVSFNTIFRVWLSEIMVFEGSADSGRYLVFNQYFDYLTFSRFIFGSFSSYISENLHNIYIGILAAVGIIGFLPYFTFMHKTLKSVSLRHTGLKSSQVAYLGLLGVILHGSSEATFLVSGVVYASSVGVLFLLAGPLPSNQGVNTIRR